MATTTTVAANGQARNRASPGQNAAAGGDERLDTLIHLNAGGAPGGAAGTGPFTWEIELPNGIYDVLSVWGDPTATNSAHSFTLEGTSVVDPSPNSGNYETYLRTVTVADGRLTVAGLPSTNAKIA